jgi:hypothetical protein
MKDIPVPSKKKRARSTLLVDPEDILVFASGGTPRTPREKGLEIREMVYRPEVSRPSDQELPIGRTLTSSFSEWPDDVFGLQKKDVKADWQRVVSQIRFVLEGVSATTENYELSEITFELGFSAKGKIVFVAEGGVTTTISAKFTRKKSITA